MRQVALRANGYRALTSQAGHHQEALQTLPLTIGLAKDRMILLDALRKSATSPTTKASR